MVYRDDGGYRHADEHREYMSGEGDRDNGGDRNRRDNIDAYNNNNRTNRDYRNARHARHGRQVRKGE